MTTPFHRALNAAVLHLLRPLVGVLLRHGMAYGTFAELARKAYVEQGFAQLRGSGKRASVSSVSALTGLTRKETKRLNELAVTADDASSQRYNRAIRVVSGWTTDPRYCDEQGEPLALPLNGDCPSFAALVKEYSGDIPPAAMLSVLKDSTTVGETGDRVELLEKAYVPLSTPLDKLHILGADVAELIDTIGHNLVSEPADRYFQRKVSNVLVHPDAIDEFRALSTRKSQHLLEEYHRWLSSHEIDPEKAPELKPSYVAVGIYYSDYQGAGEDEQ